MIFNGVPWFVSRAAGSATRPPTAGGCAPCTGGARSAAPATTRVGTTASVRTQGLAPLPGLCSTGHTFSIPGTRVDSQGSRRALIAGGIAGMGHSGWFGFVHLKYRGRIWLKSLGRELMKSLSAFLSRSLLWGVINASIHQC